MDIIGWIGGVCFGLCAIPQAYASIRQGHSRGLTWGLLVLWLVGEICTMIYVIPKRDWPLIANYVFNLLSLAPILWYKAFPRELTARSAI